jgi:hypothetical protein
MPSPVPIRVELNARKKGRGSPARKSPGRKSPGRKRRSPGPTKNLSAWRRELGSHKVGTRFSFRRSDGTLGHYRKVDRFFAEKVRSPKKR